MEIDKLFSIYGIPIPDQNKEVEINNSKEVIVSHTKDGLTHEGSNQKLTLSFVEAISGDVNSGYLLKKLAPPRVVGGNIVITIDEEEFNKGVTEFRHSLIGRLVFSKYDRLVKNDELKRRLSAIWKIKEETWRLTLLGRGYFNFHMPPRVEKSKVFSMGAFFVRPGVF